MRLILAVLATALTGCTQAALPPEQSAGPAPSELPTHLPLGAITPHAALQARVRLSKPDFEAACLNVSEGAPSVHDDHSASAQRSKDARLCSCLAERADPAHYPEMSWMFALSQKLEAGQLAKSKDEALNSSLIERMDRAQGYMARTLEICRPEVEGAAR